MKINCENIVRCANTDCIYNKDGYSCHHIIVAIGSDGRCALCKPKDRPTQNKPNKPFDIEASK